MIAKNRPDCFGQTSSFDQISSHRFTALAVSCMLSLLISACGGTGQQQKELPNVRAADDSKRIYSGPAATDQDRLNFQQFFWSNLNTTSRCGECHAGDQSPNFVRVDDVNLAYNEALSYVNLEAISSSAIISKVASGHNCWGGNPDSVCASQLNEFIGNWKNGGATAQASEVKPQALLADDIRNPNGSRPFAVSSEYFEAELYNPLLLPYCSSCHSANAAVPQQPYFANIENSNTAASEIDSAWLAVQSKLNINNPSSSRMVEYIASGHQTWSGLDYPDAANAITEAINAMLDAEDKVFYETTVRPLFTGQSCLNCHQSDTGNGAPSFASTDIDIAYAAIKTGNLIDRANPSNSPLYTRPAAGHRDCGINCSSLAESLLSAITAASYAFDTTSLHSKAAIIDGDYGSLAASTSGRFNDSVIALYQFKGPEGTVAFDSSGRQPLMNLQLSGDVEWVSGYGIRFAAAGFAEATTANSAKLTELIQASGSYSLEAWLIPANITQEQARVASYGSGTTSHNFMFGQNLYNYTLLNRVLGNAEQGISASDNNGAPELTTADDDEIAQTNKQHVVLTFDNTGRKIYVDGQLVATESDVENSPTSTNLGNWNSGYKFRLGAEVDGSNPWLGVIKFFAIHDKALSQAEISANYQADVGLKFLLQFNIAEQLNKTLSTDVQQAYIVFEVTQFDEYSYLFNAPTFIVFDEDFSPGPGVLLDGLRIGLNGKTFEVGQAYSETTVRLGDSSYTTNGQALASVGTIVPLEKGTGADEFFLVFDQLGDETNPNTTTTEPAPLTPNFADQAPITAGVKNFAQINATFSSLTGVATTNSAVQTTYDTVSQQLPTLTNLGSFDAAQQIAIAQLAIEYCNELMNDSSLREGFFGIPGAGGVDFSQAISPSIDNQIADALSTRILYQNGTSSILQGDPSRADVRDLISDLRENITTNCDDVKTDINECDSFITPSTLLFGTSYCAAILGSGLTTFQ